MKKHTFALALLPALILQAAMPADIPEDATFWSDYPAEELSRAIAERMTDEELYAQTLMFGWAGQEPSALLYQWAGRALGSVEVFGWNTDNLQKVASSVSSLQERAAQGRFAIPLFVATDQEGGSIRHVKGETSLAPSPMAIGAGGYPCDAWHCGYYLSREIKALGINMNFAPSLDLFINHKSQIIGSRSFGSDVQNVSALGIAFAAGVQAAGVIPCAKHFPGHGATALDSHGVLPVINVDKETFAKRELVPFQKMVQAAKKWPVSAMMSGHLSFPEVDESAGLAPLPASFSHYFLTDLLRGELGFDGLIITDDLMMNGGTQAAGSVSNAFRMALLAGNDILISSSTPSLDAPLWQDNLRLMQSDSRFRARVKDAAQRVIKAKLLYFKQSSTAGGSAAPLYPNPETISKYIPDKEASPVFLGMACRAVTLVQNGNAVPLRTENAGRVLLVSSSPASGEFFQQGKALFPSAETSSSWYSGASSKCDTVVCLVTGEESLALASVIGEECGKAGQAGKRFIVFLTSPPLLEALGGSLDFPSAAVLLGYDSSPRTIAALFAALQSESHGRLPF